MDHPELSYKSLESTTESITRAIGRSISLGQKAIKEVQDLTGELPNTIEIPSDFIDYSARTNRLPLAIRYRDPLAADPESRSTITMYSQGSGSKLGYAVVETVELEPKKKEGMFKRTPRKSRETTVKCVHHMDGKSFISRDSNTATDRIKHRPRPPALIKNSSVLIGEEGDPKKHKEDIQAIRNDVAKAILHARRIRHREQDLAKGKTYK